MLTQSHKNPTMASLKFEYYEEVVTPFISSLSVVCFLIRTVLCILEKWKAAYLLEMKRFDIMKTTANENDINAILQTFR